MATTKTVDDYIAGLDPHLRGIAAQLRLIVDAGLPDAECVMWHGHPVWRIAGEPVALLKAYSKYVTFGLFAGGKVADRSGRLRPGSREMASVKLSALDQIDADLFVDWLRQVR